MIQNLTSIIALLVVTTPILILVMFLPALLELKKPKDSGPRMIMGTDPGVNMRLLHVIPFVSMEDEQKFDKSLIQTLAGIIEILPSFEV